MWIKHFQSHFYLVPKFRSQRYTLRRFRPIFRPNYDDKLDTLYPVSKLSLYIGQTLPLPYTDVTRYSFAFVCIFVLLFCFVFVFVFSFVLFVCFF